jgi:hypothetical protein
MELAEALRTKVFAPIAADMVDWAKQNHAWDNQTGDLERSIKPIPITASGDVMTWGISEGMDYAKYIEARKDKGVLDPAWEHFKHRTEKDTGAVIAAWAAGELRNADH